MAEPAVKLAGMAHAAQAVAPFEGDDHFVAMQPLVEPAAVSEPPYPPSLVRLASPGRAAGRTPLASGRAHTRPAEVGGRAKWTVGWGPIPYGEAVAVRAFLETLKVGSPGGAYGFTLRPDGAGSAVTVVVRPVGAVVVGFAGGSGTGGRAVFSVGPVECEEMVQ